MAAGFAGSIYRAQDREKVESLRGPQVEAKAHAAAPGPGGIVRAGTHAGGPCTRLRGGAPQTHARPPEPTGRSCEKNAFWGLAGGVICVVMPRKITQTWEVQAGGTRSRRGLPRVHAERGRGVASRKGFREFPALDLPSRSLGDGSDARRRLRALPGQPLERMAAGRPGP
jgi:hypothetical protein